MNFNFIHLFGTLAFLTVGLVCIKFSRGDIYIYFRRVLLFWMGLFLVYLALTRTLALYNLIDTLQNRYVNSLSAIGILIIILLEIRIFNTKKA